jgi:hypothetical protein
MTPVITVGGTGVQSNKLTVAFSLGDGNGNPYAGFDKVKSTSTPASYPNFAFAVAKLVPGTNGSPSKWVSYIVTNTTGTAPQRPSTDNTGLLQYLGQGRYQYNFYRDIFNTKTQVMEMAGATRRSGDPNLNPMRSIASRSSFRARPGTGTTPRRLRPGVTAVPLKTPQRRLYFIPATPPVAPTMPRSPTADRRQVELQ